MTRFKICGIRRKEDVQYLNEALPDYAGFICAQPYWRYVPPLEVRALTAWMDGSIRRVGVFVNAKIEQIGEYADVLDVFQLHGDETARQIAELRRHFPTKQIWKAARVRTAEDIAAVDRLNVDALVLDSYSELRNGGTGELAPWDLIVQNRPEKPFFLAGGISPENVLQALEEVQPWGIDASSCLETERCKDREKIIRMTQLIRAAQI